MTSVGQADTSHALLLGAFSPEQRMQMSRDDAIAWRRVVSILIAVVTTGTVMMIGAVLACVD